jgi:two-component system, chemotaxis family, chemotaxis protein CheY
LAELENMMNFADLSVLVIDDEAFMRQLISRVLNDIGIFGVGLARNGEDGLEKVHEIGDRLDIILCDLQMPEMDGFEFVRRLRSSKTVFDPDIPVLIVTGHSDQKHISEAVQTGINGFLVKPISKANLESRLKSALKGKKIDPKVLK